MNRILKPEFQAIFEKLKAENILNDVFVENEFHKRKLSLKYVGEITLVFCEVGTVHVHGLYSTSSHSCEIAIKKYLIQRDIIDNDENFIEERAER